MSRSDIHHVNSEFYKQTNKALSHFFLGQNSAQLSRPSFKEEKTGE